MSKMHAAIAIAMYLAGSLSGAQAADVLTLPCTKTDDGRYLTSGTVQSAALKALGYTREPHFTFLNYTRVIANPCNAAGVCEDEGICTYRLRANPKGSIYF